MPLKPRRDLMAAENDKYKLPILLYDDECPLCLRFKQAMERLPGHENINKVSIHDKDVYGAHPQVTYEQCVMALHFIEVNGEVFKGGDAAAKLLHHLPGIETFAWLADSDMGKKAVDYFYKMADRYKKELQKPCPQCKRVHPHNH